MTQAKVNEANLSAAVQTKLNSGGGGNATAIASVDVSPAVTPETETVGTPARTIQNTDKVHSLVGKNNKMLYSKDFASAAWTKEGFTRVTSTGLTTTSGNPMEGMLCLAASTAHNIRMNITPASGVQYTIQWEVAIGTVYDWCAVLLTSTGTPTVYFDLVNGVVGNATAVDDARIQLLENGNYLVSVVVTGTGASMSARLYSAQANGDASFPGDDSSTYLYYGDPHWYNGILADNTQYVDTEAVEVSGPALMVLQDDIAKKQAAGFLQQKGATGWGLPQCGDGIEWIAPLSEQNRGCGAKVFCQHVALSGLATGTDTDILTISNAGKLVPRGSRVSFYNTASAQWWSIDGGGTSADTFYVHTKIGALNSILQVRVGTNYATPNTAEAVIYYTKS